MAEKTPPHGEQIFSRKNLDEYSDLLDELARIRKDIEQESLPASLFLDFGQNRSNNRENSSHSNVTNEVSRDSQSLPTDSLRRCYRFDLEHLERKDFGCLNVVSENTGFSESTKNDTNISFFEKKSRYLPDLEQAEEKSKQFFQTSKSRNSEINRNNYRYDDGPVLIPIRHPETKIPKQNSKLAFEKAHKNHRLFQNDTNNNEVTEFASLPWGLISQYENESFANLAANAGNLSLVIGWGAIASGVVIFVRSFFVSSMIWLNYGMPVVALGAACLFLGIILNILSDKMQHINDLKQSLTAHQILNPSPQKIDPPPTHQNECSGLEDVYDRLIKLRSEINELIDECENP